MPRLPSHHRDSLGRLVLIGLTFEETEEFERLDATPALDKDGCLFPWPTDGNCLPRSERRWLELYEKHIDAYRLLDQITRLRPRRNEDATTGRKSVRWKESPQNKLRRNEDDEVLSVDSSADPQVQPGPGLLTAKHRFRR
jgi:hypothetical protein